MYTLIRLSGTETSKHGKTEKNFNNYEDAIVHMTKETIKMIPDFDKFEKYDNFMVKIDDKHINNTTQFSYKNNTNSVYWILVSIP